MSPAEHDTVISVRGSAFGLQGFGVAGLGGGFEKTVEPFTVSVMLLTVTGD
jgi:hypothetical protein